MKLTANQELARFKKLSNLALTLTGSPQDVFNNVAKLIGDLLDVKVVCLSEVRDDELYFLSVYVEGQMYSNVGHCDLSITPCATVECDKEIRVYEHVAELFPEAEFLKTHNAFSYCGFPALNSSGKVVAVTCLLDDKPHEFTEEDQDLLRIFGQRIGLEIERVEIQNKLRKQEEQFRLSQKMEALGKLTGGIAHDYNNMLSVITGYAEVLEEDLKDQPKLSKYAYQIRRAGERSAKLTQKLLASSKKKPIIAENIYMNEVLQGMQHMLEKTLTARIKLIFDFDENIWPSWLDSNDFEDAILNLSINAMHAIEGNGQLTFQTQNKIIGQFDAQLLNLKAGDYVILSITDTGSGMDEAIKDNIFDPFYSTKGDKGTGLGLSQVYGFVDRSNGIIKVYSEVDHGTQFILYFPRYIEGSFKKKSNKVISTTDLNGNENILVVDDESALLELTCEILGARGYNVFSAENAKQAINILNNEHIDLLLTDVIMPDIDGYQLVSLAREINPKIKLQLISGFSDSRHVDMVDCCTNQ